MRTETATRLLPKALPISESSRPSTYRSARIVASSRPSCASTVRIISPSRASAAESASGSRRSNPSAIIPSSEAASLRSRKWFLIRLPATVYRKARGWRISSPRERVAQYRANASWTMSSAASRSERRRRQNVRIAAACSLKAAAVSSRAFSSSPDTRQAYRVTEPPLTACVTRRPPAVSRRARQPLRASCGPAVSAASPVKPAN